MQKEVGELSYQGPHISLTSATYTAIKSIFLHLLRNSVDLGIKLPEERLAIGKEKLAKITIKVEEDKDFLIIFFRDDGAGIDTNQLLKAMPPEGDSSAKFDSPFSIANLIFSEGLSTSPTVDHISGRGMGMSAVRRSVEGLDGSIYLTDLERVEGNFITFTNVIRLPKSHFVLPAYFGRTSKDVG